MQRAYQPFQFVNFGEWNLKDGHMHIRWGRRPNWRYLSFHLGLVNGLYATNLMFFFNFLSCLMQALGVVNVVRPSIYALIGGSLNLGLSCSPSTAHCEVWMITSIVMTKADG